MKNVYSIKFLYFNAGKAVLNHCADYCRNLANKSVIPHIYDNFIKNSFGTNLFVNDKSAVQSHNLLSFFIEMQDEDSLLFVYEDCLADGLWAGVYCPRKNLFIYNNRNENTDIDINDCYVRRDETVQEIQRFYTLANDYFIKSDCIDIPNNL